ncbi:hypothetical protein E4U21_006485 [Claviceps maximensis]|nr:hypothetical protein E4U21_006485 [Claviceps maximensis]
MKAAIIALAASAAVVSAAPGGEIPFDVPINCAKPNANYCMAGDIILRCDGNKIGHRGRCSDNVAGYPPFGGIASCYQSSQDSGDAACQKNCVVYAAQPFTLPADKCTPIATATQTTIPEGTTTTKPMTTNTGIMTTPEGTSHGCATGSDTDMVSTPKGTSSGTASVTASAPAPTSPDNGGFPYPIHNSTTTPSRTGPVDCPTSTMPQWKPTTVQPTTTGPASTTVTSAVPTAAANTKPTAGAMAVAGLIAALLL